jgi:hypothetical protein
VPPRVVKNKIPIAGRFGTGRAAGVQNRNFGKEILPFLKKKQASRLTRLFSRNKEI